MPVAPTLREPPIPLPHDPAIAGSKPAPEIEIRRYQALCNLVWLVAYVAIMRLFGYRMPRPPARATARPAAQTSTPAIPLAPRPAAPPASRQTHRTIDRAFCLDLLASITGAFAAPKPAAADPVSVRATRIQSRRPVPAHPPGQPQACCRYQAAYARPAPTHPPPRQKPASPLTPRHVHFVATS